jgi:hypothetical protein
MSKDNFYKGYMGMTFAAFLSVIIGNYTMEKITGKLANKAEKNSIKPEFVQEYSQQKARIDSAYQVELSAFAKHKSQLEHTLDSSNRAMTSKYESKLDSLRHFYHK